MSAQKIQIIGIGDDGAAGLTAAARNQIEAADLVMGEAGPLAAVSALVAGRQHPVEGNLKAVVAALREHDGKRIVILASGDPLFYGMARYLCQQFGKERFDVLPHVSSMQLAFARLKESWDDAYLANLATQPMDRVLEKIRTSQKAGLFTTEEATPQAIAQALLDRQIDYFKAYVCENLGGRDECVTQAPIDELAAMEFNSLNVLVLVRLPDTPDRPAAMIGRRLFGNPDEMFLQSKPQRGLLTPSEVRCIALSQLDLGSRSVVWDVGAGSGSVAVEAAQIAASGEVFAIEMAAEDHGLISANAERFGVGNLVPVLGQAPDAWSKLPDPDAIFIGGTGRVVARIAEQAVSRLKPGGRIVVNVSSIENVAAVRETLTRLCGEARAWMVQISRGNDQLESLRFDSLQPSFLLGAVRPEE